jgi:transcriptional regulator with XRE-family HTH domain
MGRLAARRIRTLRKERGWSAQQLADECSRTGMGSLTRSTIAKIESGVRRVTADEVTVLARALGVTASELLESTGARVFLSYAEQDSETALEIATSLGEQGFEVYRWQDLRGGRFIERTEQEISRADAFLVLLSPNYLASSWCRQERELAMHRELDLQASDPSRVFIHVLQIADAPYAPAGFLRHYDWFNLTTAAKRAEGLRALTDRFMSTGDAAAVSRGPQSRLFRNRRDELDTVQRALTDAAGPHFWLVIGPTRTWQVLVPAAAQHGDGATRSIRLGGWTLPLDCQACRRSRATAGCA